MLDVWDIDFMRPFLSSHGIMYILVVIYDVPKWVEVIKSPTINVTVSSHSLKQISSLNLVNLGILFVMEFPTFSISC